MSTEEIIENTEATETTERDDGVQIIDLGDGITAVMLSGDALKRMLEEAQREQNEIAACLVSDYSGDGFDVVTMQVPPSAAGERVVYQTGIAHPDFNGGDWIVAAEYESRDAAQTGHDAWVAKLNEHTPDEIRNCNTVPSAIPLASDVPTYQRNLDERAA